MKTQVHDSSLISALYKSCLYIEDLPDNVLSFVQRLHWVKLDGSRYNPSIWIEVGVYQDKECICLSTVTASFHVTTELHYSFFDLNLLAEFDSFIASLIKQHFEKAAQAAIDSMYIEENSYKNVDGWSRLDNDVVKTNYQSGLDSKRIPVINYAIDRVTYKEGSLVQATKEKPYILVDGGHKKVDFPPDALVPILLDPSCHKEEGSLTEKQRMLYNYPPDFTGNPREFIFDSVDIYYDEGLSII